MTVRTNKTVLPRCYKGVSSVRQMFADMIPEVCIDMLQSAAETTRLRTEFLFLDIHPT